VIWIRISDPVSLRSWHIKGTNKPTLHVVTDSSAPLMHNNYKIDFGLINDPDPDHPKGIVEGLSGKGVVEGNFLSKNCFQLIHCARQHNT